MGVNHAKGRIAIFAARRDRAEEREINECLFGTHYAEVLALGISVRASRLVIGNQIG